MPNGYLVFFCIVLLSATATERIKWWWWWWWSVIYVTGHHCIKYTVKTTLWAPTQSRNTQRYFEQSNSESDLYEYQSSTRTLIICQVMWRTARLEAELTRQQMAHDMGTGGRKKRVGRSTVNGKHCSMLCVADGDRLSAWDKITADLARARHSSNNNKCSSPPFNWILGARINLMQSTSTAMPI